MDVAKVLRSVHWFRRDLRISDNTALTSAAAHSKEVIPLFVLSEWSVRHSWTGPGRQQFLCDCLASLDQNLRAIGGRLIIRRGSALDIFRSLIREVRVEAIHYNKDPDPFGIAQEQALISLAKEQGLNVYAHDDVDLHKYEQTKKDDGTSYRVYTPYSKKWLKLPKTKPQPKLKTISTPANLHSEPLPSLATWQLALAPKMDLLPGGEKAARERLKSAIQGRLKTYERDRDVPSAAATSRLSQDLRWGTISIRTVFDQANKQLESNESQLVRDSFAVFIKELAWRDFYLHLLQAFPNVLEEEFNSNYRGLPWSEPTSLFDAWKEGQTGFPIVDAGMRQLLQTGFMHNRVRMIVAMFLTKDLHVDWRLGEQHFAQNLLDGEIASNNGGWQWSAGTGADAAPYFRIQNPWTQSKRFDPNGDYIRTWVPELANIPAKLLHQPPNEGCAIQPCYPQPIVDHSTERNRTLEMFKAHLSQARGQA